MQIILKLTNNCKLNERFQKDKVRSPNFPLILEYLSYQSKLKLMSGSKNFKKKKLGA